MADIKATENKTGTLFYTKIREGTPSFRVRFRSFQQVLLENKEIKEELSQMEVNYNYFKYPFPYTGTAEARHASRVCNPPCHNQSPNSTRT
jgi:hypothetical protein